MKKLFYPKDIINKIEINKKLKQLAKEKDNISSEGNLISEIFQHIFLNKDTLKHSS